MCGYIGNMHECPEIIRLMVELGLPIPYPIQRLYAYRWQNLAGGFLLEHEGSLQMREARWWYDHKLVNGEYVPNINCTSFNARELNSPLWKDAARERRGIIFATELGESDGKQKYLMQSSAGFALGCVYRQWEINRKCLVSFAVITRDPVDSLKKYHQKSTPLFLPLDIELIKEWLDPRIPTSRSINHVLKSPAVPEELKVTPVKSYEHAYRQPSLF